MDAKVATGPDATATRGVDDGREWIMYDFGGTRSSVSGSFVCVVKHG